MASSLHNWGEILRTQNLSPERAMDTVSRWLLITRASVFPMTITSAVIGGLLALSAPRAEWVYFAAALLGLVLAHAANNMINDFFDLETGVDSDEYVRSIRASTASRSRTTGASSSSSAARLCPMLGSSSGGSLDSASGSGPGGVSGRPLPSAW